MRLLKKEISFGQAKYFPDEITEQSEEYYDNIQIRIKYINTCIL